VKNNDPLFLVAFCILYSADSYLENLLILFRLWTLALEGQLRDTNSNIREVSEEPRNTNDLPKFCGDYI
jgi:hypothetical protein